METLEKGRSMLTWPDSSLTESIRRALVGPDAPFEIVEELVAGTRVEVFRRRPKSLLEILESGAQRFGDRPYVDFPQRRLSFASMLEPVAAIANALQSNFGIKRGDRVAIASANRLEFVLSFWATTALGAVTVALNGWWTEAEMAYALQLTDPKVLLGDERRLDRVAGSTPAGLPVMSFDGDFEELSTAEGVVPLPSVEIDEDDPYVILFTSGTTGRSKAAVISHRSTIHFGLATQLRAAETIARSMAAGEPAPDPYVPCSIAAAPMFHVGGLNCTLALGPLTGMTMVYPSPGRWSEETHLRLTEAHRATAWSLVPTQLSRLLDWPSLEEYDLSSLRTVGGGSAVWAPELLDRLEHRIPWARPGLGLGYGMTETNGLGTSLRAEHTYTHPDSIGQAAPTVQVDVRDPLTRSSLPDGELGEIALRSAASFSYYWNDREATAKALDDERWYHTGDFGLVRSGFLYLQGRRQDLIIRGGENIYPVEIENRLSEHPGVVEAAVVGMDHPVLGQEVTAFVVSKTPGGLSEEDIKEWCRVTLAEFKVPAHVTFLEELPHNAVGKVLKPLLTRPGADNNFIQE